MIKKKAAGQIFLAATFISLSLSLTALAALPPSPQQAQEEAGFVVSASDDSSLGKAPAAAPLERSDPYFKGYEPGGLNVRLPAALLPPSYEVELDAPLDYPVAAGGLNPAGLPDPVVPPARMEQIQPGDPDYKPAVDGSGVKAPSVQYRTVPSKSKKVRKLIQPPSPYEVPTPGNFSWLHNKAGDYNLPVPYAFGGNPLDKLPLDGPMLVRSQSTDRMMAFTVDDPTDTRYYSNQNSFPTLTVYDNIVTEHRPLVENKTGTILYQRVNVGEVTCLALTASYKVGTKTYRGLYIFPEEEKYTLLPRCIYSIENLRLRY